MIANLRMYTAILLAFLIVPIVLPLKAVAWVNETLIAPAIHGYCDFCEWVAGRRHRPFTMDTLCAIITILLCIGIGVMLAWRG